jgi:hypothetical protein
MLIVEQNCLRTHGTSWVILRAEISRRRSKMFMQWLRPLETLGVCTCHMCHTNAVFVPCTGCTCQSISDISFINNNANCNANWREVCLGVEPMFGAICLLSLVDIPMSSVAHLLRPPSDEIHSSSIQVWIIMPVHNFWSICLGLVSCGYFWSICLELVSDG